MTFTAQVDGGVSQLYLRHLDKGESIQLSGTEGAAYPFWSPGSDYIGFFDPNDNKLKKVAAAGGPSVTLCAAPNGKGGSWNSRGEIIFAPDYNVAIHKVRDIGGDPVPVTTVGPEHDSHRHPRFLPDGRHFLFTGRVSAGNVNDVLLASLDTTVVPRVIGETEGHADYLQGNLLFIREGVLMAVPFLPAQVRPTEGAIPLVENIMTLGAAAVGIFSPSETGMLVYQTGASSQAQQVISWVEIANGAQEALGEPGRVFHPFIAPNGEQALIEVRDASTEGTDLWLLDLTTGLKTRFTFAPGDEKFPCWSSDGESVFYGSIDGGAFRILQQPVEGQGGAAILHETSRVISPTSVSPDGRYLLVNYEREDGNNEVRRMALESGEEELVTLASMKDGNAGMAKYSPDGRWIAYHSETAAGWDVFVISADGGTRKWQVTTDGAVYPRWNGDGTELWVSQFDGDLFVYPVDGSGQTFRVGEATHSLTTEAPGAGGCYYDLHPDGVRLLQTGVDPAYRTEVSHLHLVTDWSR